MQPDQSTDRGKIRLYDVHNHLQDERFGTDGASIIAACRGEQIAKMIVNGSCEEDWPAVAALARQYAEVIPAFGYHPWYVNERTASWEATLQATLDSMPSSVGEIGLDRWKQGLEYAGQEEAFTTQLRIAAERNLPVSIHCLLAWGRLYDLLRAGPRPQCGFLLHSYGGPQEMVVPFGKLGAYFSFPGYYARERKQRQREAFRNVPPDRLLIETDAPDQLLPEERVRYPLKDAEGKPLNHPANLPAVYEVVADLFGQSVEKLAQVVEENFFRLFGNVARRQGR